jgi:hypothetical protein
VSIPHTFKSLLNPLACLATGSSCDRLASLMPSQICDNHGDHIDQNIDLNIDSNIDFYIDLHIDILVCVFVLIHRIMDQ